MRAALVLSGLLLAEAGSPLAAQGDLGDTGPDAQRCEASSRRLFGEPPAPIGGETRAPKRLHHVAPKYPDLPPGTIGSGIWVGEALIGPDGRVSDLSVVQDLKLKPPFPQFSRAISDAILQWRYAPTTIDGKAVPICLTVTVNIDWR